MFSSFPEPGRTVGDWVLKDVEGFDATPTPSPLGNFENIDNCKP